MKTATLSLYNARHLGRDQRFQQLLDELVQRNISPQDRYEIAALLETMGWNDLRVYQAFGLEGVFELAEEIWELMQQKILVTSFSKPVEKSRAQLLYEMIRSFLRGLIFALPMALSVVSMLTLKFSLWAYEDLSVDMATCVAAGTILSFLTVGGFTQAIARKGFFYLFQGYYNMGRKVAFSFIRIGYVMCGAVALAVALFNVVFNLFPPSMLGLSLAYFVFMTTIWLSVTVMYMLRKELVFTGLLMLGIGLVFVLFRLLHIDILLSQVIAMAAVAASGMLLAIVFFKQAEAREEKGIAPKLPRLSLNVYSVMPYFTYGFLYFLFLYVDRVMAWSTNAESMPFFLWFRGDYELGLDFALLVLLLPLGVSEVVVGKLMEDLEAAQKGYWGFETERMCRHFWQVYCKWVGVTAGASVVSIVLVSVLLVLFNDRYYAFSGKHLMANATTYWVYGVGVVAYVILALGLMNAMILFSLAQPKLVNRTIWPAVVVNAVCGFLLSRWVGYSEAVYGLLAGALVFAWLSGREMKRVLHKVDYYLYAAS